MSFAKLLIANRGEIACRVIATARQMGIATVAVYSDADRDAPHVALADEARRVGPAPARESYLDAQAILAAAQATGAEAIHPGYGFLSENADFAEAVSAAGLTFVGPPASAIRAMGLKDAAKALMEQANIPVVPGYHGADQDPERLAQEAAQIGYPVLIKARAGGGGKGMRLVEAPAAFPEALAAAQREASASFGDPHCLIEKYITQPRHIEIQLFADSHGNVVHLFERDCSLQRRHQKVLEEAPAPGMPEEVRHAMGQAAVEAARAIGYQGAGTVEFIADGSQGLRPDGFWFMEMNTRLQVEHPVTEAVTGQDLVALQLKVAAGAPLPFPQAALTLTGHAFEARLYAEDPTRGFLPATGRLHHLVLPAGARFAQGECRVDAGVTEGQEVSPHYDPMLAKIITHGPDRATALVRMRAALKATEIAGLTTNLPFLRALCADADVARGAVDTGLIAAKPGLVAAKALPSIVRDTAAMLAAGLAPQPRSGSPWDQLSGWRAWGPAEQSVRLETEGTVIEAQVRAQNGAIHVDGRPLALHRSGDRLQARQDQEEARLRLVDLPQGFALITQGETYAFRRPDPLAQSAHAGEASDEIRAPMPGKVTAVAVAEGAAVQKGDPLLTLEAMKMEHALTAPRDGSVGALPAALGAQVQAGDLLVRLRDVDGDADGNADENEDKNDG